MHKDIKTKKGWRYIVIDIGKALGIRYVFDDSKSWFAYGHRIGFWFYKFRGALKKILVIQLKISLTLFEWIFNKDNKGFRLLTASMYEKGLRALLGITYYHGFDICRLRGEIIEITIHFLFFRYTYTKILKPYKGEDN